MAKSPVKFYSVTSAPTAASVVAGAVYFVQGGELYKETQRFGLARVTDISSLNNDETVDSENLQAKINALAPNAARGDLAYGYGAAKVYNGSTWVDLGADSSATDSLASRVSAIETVVSVVTATPEGEAEPTTTTVSADSGYFTDLSVAGTADFVAMTISATTITVGGSTIEQIADSCIAAISESYAVGSSNGIEVSVTTAGGNVTGVTVNASAFANVMVFKGVVNESSSGAPDLSGAIGDVILIGSEANIGWYNIGTGESPATGALTPGEAGGTGYTPATVGQEYVCVDVDQDGHCKWELIGDQNTGATKGYVDAAIASSMTYSSNTGVTSGATTLSGAVQALATAVDGAKTALSSDDTGNSNLVTAGAVVDYVATEVSNLHLGNAAQSTVLTEFPAQDEDDGLVTANTIARYVQEIVGGISADSIGYTAYYDAESGGPSGFSGGVTYSTSTVEAAIQTLDQALAGIREAQVSAGTATTTSQTVVFSVTFSSNAAPSMTVTGLGATASMAVATSIGPSVSVSGQEAVEAQGTEGQEGYVPAQPAVEAIPAASDDNLATEKAVRDAIEAARTEFQMMWYDDEDL